MRKFKFYQINSFTNKKFGGNPTAAVFNSEHLSDQEMKSFAIEMQNPETSYILPSSKANFKLRFFTRGGDEIKLCGHALIGALHAIANEHKFGVKIGELNQLKAETNAGILSVSIDLRNPTESKYIFQLPALDFAKSEISPKNFCNLLEIPEELIDQTKPLMHDRFQNYLYCSSPSLQKLGEIHPNSQLAKAFCQKHGIVLMGILTAQTFEPHNQLHARCFAPAVGIEEDPFTGSMQGGVALYALQNGMLPENTRKIKSEQGHFLDRPGSAEIEISSMHPFSAEIKAQAVTVYDAELTL